MNLPHTVRAIALGTAVTLLVACSSKDERMQASLVKAADYARSADWDKANVEIRNVLQIDPKNAQAYFISGQVADGKRDFQRAYGSYLKAVELKPNDGYITDSLGWAYFQLGDYEQAVIHCERAVELLPADPIIAEHLGDAYWRVGRRLEARFQWQHAKDNEPEPEDLKRIEDKLKNGLPDEQPVTPVQNTAPKTNG